MARLPRIVIPDVAHHVTQRGNRRLPIFFNDDDRTLYLDLVAAACIAHDTRCLAWCLMTNHVHLILVPTYEDGLRATLAEAHRRYARHVNFREGWRGYLFQGRFGSYPMDDAHLMAAIRYVENNPVKAGMVASAGDWRWSSARSHVMVKRAPDDPLTDIASLAGHVRDWRKMLAFGWAAGDSDEADAAIEARMTTGRPLADQPWIKAAELAMNRTLAPLKPGPKPKSGIAA